MKIVMQCAATKTPDAGHLTARGRKPVYFVARPECAPQNSNMHYARPDDIAEGGKTWREVLLAYNACAKNPFHLQRACRLYANPVYSQLAETFGAENLFILSAGWGLVSANFLLPAYDITFSNAKNVQRYKRRVNADRYCDFNMLPTDCGDELAFLGGKSYWPLFAKLTAHYRGERFLFYNSKKEPVLRGCTPVKYQTGMRTNWHYACAKYLIDGKICARKCGIIARHVRSL